MNLAARRRNPSFRTLLLLGALFLLLPGCRGEERVEPTAGIVEKAPLKAERSREDYEESIRNFRALLRKEPDNLIILIALGNAYFDIGRDLDAIEVYRKALSIHPNNVAVRTDLGTLYRRIGQPDRAVEEYRKSLAIDPRHSISRYNMGVVLFWDKKDMKGAIRIWEELLRIDPYFVLAEELRSNIQLLKDTFAEAEGRRH